MKKHFQFMQWPSARDGDPNCFIKIKIFIGMYIDVARSWGLAIVRDLGMSAHYSGIDQ
jgi:hypothetical protein